MDAFRLAHLETAGGRTQRGVPATAEPYSVRLVVALAARAAHECMDEGGIGEAAVARRSALAALAPNPLPLQACGTELSRAAVRAASAAAAPLPSSSKPAALPRTLRTLAAHVARQHSEALAALDHLCAADVALVCAELQQLVRSTCDVAREVATATERASLSCARMVESHLLLLAPTVSSAVRAAEAAAACAGHAEAPAAHSHHTDSRVGIAAELDRAASLVCAALVALRCAAHRGEPEASRHRAALDLSEQAAGASAHLAALQAQLASICVSRMRLATGTSLKLPPHGAGAAAAPIRIAAALHRLGGEERDVEAAIERALEEQRARFAERATDDSMGRQGLVDPPTRGAELACLAALDEIEQLQMAAGAVTSAGAAEVARIARLTRSAGAGVVAGRAVEALARIIAALDASARRRAALLSATRAASAPIAEAGHEYAVSSAAETGGDWEAALAALEERFESGRAACRATAYAATCRGVQADMDAAAAQVASSKARIAAALRSM